MEIDSPENPKRIEDPLNFRSTLSKPVFRVIHKIHLQFQCGGTLHWIWRAKDQMLRKGGVSVYVSHPSSTRVEEYNAYVISECNSILQWRTYDRAESMGIFIGGNVGGAMTSLCGYLVTILERQWTVNPGMRVISFANGYFLFNFTSEKDKSYAISGGPWVASEQLLALETRMPNFRLLWTLREMVQYRSDCLKFLRNIGV